MADTAAHEEKETLSVDINIPEHEVRGAATPLFTRTRKALIERENDRCWVCGRPPAESGHPNEAHHHPAERCFADMIDWKLFSVDAIAGHWGPYAQGFDWACFFGSDGEPMDVYKFVDDMTVNGLLLCKDHHTVADSGIHTIPYPIFLAQKYGKEGYVFTAKEVIHHAV